MNNNILNITTAPIHDNTISKFEYHSYSPFLQSYNVSDEIRIPIHQQDLCILPCESFIYIEGSLTKEDGTISQSAKLCNNAMAFLFEEIHYELNGIVIEQNKNVGITTTIKNYISLNENESKSLQNASWSGNESISTSSGVFNFCIPLKMLLGFAEDYKKIITSTKHELVLIRTRNDDNAIISPNEVVKLKIFKLQWRVPHITLADAEKLTLLKQIQTRPIQIYFRNWEMYEYPILPEAPEHIWSIKTSSQLEKPRYIIIALQTNRKNQRVKDISKFDNCDISNIKVHLNSETYPYEDLNVKFARERYAILYDMYTKFQQSYYGRTPSALLSKQDYKNDAPIIVIDCSHQNEAIKSGTIDVKVELKTNTSVPPLTSMYCVIIHDRIIEYSPITGEIRKLT